MKHEIQSIHPARPFLSSGASTQQYTKLITVVYINFILQTYYIYR